MNIKYIIFAILFSVLYSCNTITEKDLTVVEGIKLGEKGQVAYDKQMEELGNKKVKFSLFDYFAMFISEPKPKVKYNGYITKVFTGTKYDSKDLKHSAPIIQEMNESTDILEGVAIPLCHSVITRADPDLQIYQAVAVGFFDEVKKMLIAKYGKPTDTVYGYSIPYFSDNGVSFREPNINFEPLPGYKWKTKAVDILLACGKKSDIMYYNKILKTYMSAFSSNLAPWDGSDPTYDRCYEYSFIRYGMNQKALEKFEANKPKL